MTKIKVQHKNAQIIVTIKRNKHESLNHRELQVFNTKLIRGLMRPKLAEKNKITYVAPNGIALRTYLISGISKNDFFIIFAQVVEMTKKLQSNGFNINNLLLNLKYTFINMATKEVHFIYQPIINPSAAVNIFTFFYELSHAAVFRLNEDIDFLNELLNFLRNMQAYSPQDIEKYLLAIYPKVYTQVQRHKTGPSQALHSSPPFSDGALGENEGTSLLNENEDTLFLDEQEGTSLLTEIDDEGTSLLHDSIGTTLIDSNPTNCPYLLRLSNYDHIDINKPVFRIGKEKNVVDYDIADNNAVSRLHADIIKNVDNYYIRDNNSSNKTFVNGTMIEVNQDVPLFDGDTIMLANEAFEFHWNE